MRPGTTWGELRDRRGSVSTDDELGCFHLDLKAEPAGRKPVDFFEAGHCEVHRLHLGHCGDLGQGEDQAGREFAGRGQRGDEQVQCLQAASLVGGASKHLNRMPMNGGAVPAETAVATALAAATASASSASSPRSP